MVHYGKYGAFNKSVWVPRFGLTTVKTLLRVTVPDYCMVYLVKGNRFLNFRLDKLASQYVVVDLTIFSQNKLENTWL